MSIPITRPCFDESEFELIRQPLERGWLVQGPFVAEFERAFADFVGTPLARATSNCTTALHLALEALGIGEGDRVIVPAFTYIASANAVEYTGARVVFCDIDLTTFNLDLAKLQALLEADQGRSIRAIMPVHLFGLCADMPAILALSERYGLKVVEDAACGTGARIGVQHAGTFGEAGCFSFHPRKSITTGEGGMVTTRDPELAAKVSCLRDHGAGKSDLQRHQEQGGSLLPDFAVRGYNYRMTDLQAALGLSQLKRLDEFVARRQALASRYDKLLADLLVRTPSQEPDNYSSVHLYVIRLQIDKIKRTHLEVFESLHELGIGVSLHYIPVYCHPYYEKMGFRSGYCSQAEKYYSEAISIPIYPGLSDTQQDSVVTALRKAIGS